MGVEQQSASCTHTSVLPQSQLVAEPLKQQRSGRRTLS